MDGEGGMDGGSRLSREIEGGMGGMGRMGGGEGGRMGGGGGTEGRMGGGMQFGRGGGSMRGRLGMSGMGRGGGGGGGAGAIYDFKMKDMVGPTYNLPPIGNQPINQLTFYIYIFRILFPLPPLYLHSARAH